MITTYFGNPGCGKTTLAVKMMFKNRRKYSCFLANFQHSVPGAGFVHSLDGLGSWTPPPGTLLLIDEAGIEYNNRNFKTFPKVTLSWFKLHRHMRCDAAVFSQSWDDMDVTIRRLSPELWYMYRLGPWTLCRRLYKRVTVDKNTQQIIDGYKMASMLWLFIWPLQLGWPFDKKFTLTFRPFYYRYFDSWSDANLPIRTGTQNHPPAPLRDRIRKAWHLISGAAVRFYFRFREVCPWVKK